MAELPAIPFQIRRFESLDSTNRYLLDEARAGAPEGIVVVADHQSAGRGRRGRSWVAPAGSSLLCSVLLRPPLPAARAHLVTMAAGLAMRAGVLAVGGFTPELKWPNDLVVEGRKLAGTLTETEVASDGTALVVVGIGVNVEWRRFPPELESTATACDLVAGRAVDRDALLGAYLRNLGERYRDLDAVASEYRRDLGTLGRRIRVERPRGEVVGRAVDLGPAGELLVEVAPDCIVDVPVGDVVHLRY